MVTRRSFMGQLAVAGAAGAYFGETLIAGHAQAKPAAPSTMAWLDANENPAGPPRSAIEAMVHSAPHSWRYHFDEFNALTQAIAQSEQVAPEQVMFGVGSSEVIASAICAFASATKPMITASPTYDIIVQLARAMGKAVVEIPLTQQWSYPVKQLAAEATKAGGGLIYLCNPNNPTASLTAKEDVHWLVNNLPPDTVLFVDEAYLEFVDPNLAESAIKYVRDQKNVVVARTFSKIYGMAGVRAGFGCARQDLIAAMNPFMDNVIPYLGVRAATAALQEKATLLPERRNNNTRIRGELCQWLDAHKVRYIPSHANFIMIDVKREVRPFSAAMFREGVAVGRPFPPLNTMLRVTLGNDADMQRFRQAFLKLYST
ncbi:aminotransferase class I/II-fold pyridoxal phosphate-dependent enzyme [Steroidobacter sp.]|uniref:aminotransferase class I/II-fold pyridoxal phosphate-dependent enzyme n=1 Tax=Steroidobacter sp. TaxID=1978227 RepID=UPI001A42D39B|nr:aminotransferase class I/II-fold pyridoxal phosphate-dependent enzyme [Steroidobacter sp.]MBL8271713.1 aminotransferase class I/II-fold pyridoxal phosphate-dependent enzyme [Steroidobacter sp.]